jgi:drug/metabolite transporter (DMT)-like permease
MASPVENRRGIVMMLIAMACYVLNDAFIKVAASHYTTGQILALRGICASLIVLALASRAGAIGHWRALARPIVALRAVLEIATAVTSVMALSLMSLATVTSLMMTAPLIVVAFSMSAGRESWRADRVLAAGLGFAGVLVVLRPSLEGSALGLAFALACAGSLAARDLVNRRIPEEVPSILITAATTLAVTAAGMVMSAMDTRRELEAEAFAWIAGAAVFAALGNYAVVAASRGVDLSVVAPFRYSSIVWALLIAYAFWGEAPDWRICTGVALISASGLYMLRGVRSPSKV